MAAKTDSRAQIALGDLYATGSGLVPVDGKLAFDLYSKSAKQNNLDAYAKLGAFYEKGDVVPQNLVAAADAYRMRDLLSKN